MRSYLAFERKERVKHQSLNQSELCLNSAFLILHTYLTFLSTATWQQIQALHSPQHYRPEQYLQKRCSTQTKSSLRLEVQKTENIVNNAFKMFYSKENCYSLRLVLLNIQAKVT
jgi:hypothetical protein